MKKSYFSILLAVLMLAGSVNVFAQKKNVSKAKAKILAEVPDTKAAREAILPALVDPTTKDLANTWFIAGEVFTPPTRNSKSWNGSRKRAIRS